MAKLNILLTFDYELPLGGIKKDYSDALFEPTEKLLHLAEQLQIPLVFFADILSYVQFKKWNVENYCLPFKNQLQEALTQGHDIQLHTHSHWLDSRFENQRFIPSDKFELADFPDNEIEQIIQLSIEELNGICKEVSPDYQCVAYRAGGFNLNRSAKTILNALHRNGVRFDSSVVKGYFFSSAVSYVDYRKTASKCNWCLDFAGDFSKENSSGIMEIPIASKPKSFFEIPTRFKLKTLENRAVDRGFTIHTKKNANPLHRVRQLLSSRMLTVDNYTYSADYLIDILKYNVSKYKKETPIYLSLIGHPKSMGGYSLELLAEFVTQTRNLYKNEVQFCTFTHLAHSNGFPAIVFP
ncbi:MAG: hypothetical protein FWH36_04195 [Lentimicrobiaceae bacterium]|nr:hypothetical protein [Lentimicrobiaceae bacterium]